MPQETNLNVTPYFDDFDDKKNFYKVLFKPGYPIQSRELTTLQSILQNQIEKFGSHIFKEGSPVLGGNIVYNNYFEGIQVEPNYLGISVDSYLNNFIGKYIIGQDSQVTARVEFILPANESPTGNTIIYVSYRDSNSSQNTREFNSGEVLLSQDDVPVVSGGFTTIQSGQGVSRVTSENSSIVGSSVTIADGVYFIRGYFVNINSETLILDPVANNVNYSIGLKITEDIVTSDDDESLVDNSQGFTNFAAPGADRLSITASLAKYSFSESQDEGYIELFKVVDGSPDKVQRDAEYNLLANEFARRTYDESGDYYVSPFKVDVRESLDNLKGNKGIFKEGQTTYGNNAADESLGIYKVSPGKAYIRGFEVEIPNPTFIDFPKPRLTKTLKNQSIVYTTGSTFTLNRVNGNPSLGISTDYTVTLRSERLGVDDNIAPGKEIGLARVYDFALESGSYNSLFPNSNEWDITLFDVQPYIEFELNNPVTLQVPTFIKGSSSGASAYLRESITNSGIVTAYNVEGKFLRGERLSFDGIQNNRIIKSFTQYDVNDFKSIYGEPVGSGATFSADLIQTVKAFAGFVSISPVVGGISTVTSSDFTFSGKSKIDDIVAYSTPGNVVPTYAKVSSISERQLEIEEVTPVSGVCVSTLPASELSVSDFRILKSGLQSSTDNTLFTVFPKDKISSLNLENSELIVRKQTIINISGNSSQVIVLPNDERFLPYDEERYSVFYPNGSTDTLREDKFSFTLGSQNLRINGLSASTGTAVLTYTVKKLNVSAKIKNRNRVNSIVVDKSKYNYSGIGQTTVNDGLEFGNYPYGTRVQDESICLRYPDVTKLLGVFETSSTVGTPELQSITLDLNTLTTSNLILGEEIVGQESKCVAILVERINTNTVSYISLNSSEFISGEGVEFKESNVVSTISSLNRGNCKDITRDFVFDNGQKNTFYDYAKITRKDRSREPLKKLKIVFESTSINSADEGSFFSVDSYSQFDYCNIPSFQGIKNYNILDLRPRVSPYIVSEGVRSPFESLSNNFVNVDNQNTPILASDEDIILDFSYYLPRIDKIVLSKEGQFELMIGDPAENPQAPLNLSESLDIATITLPAYFCTNDEVGVNLSQHKRYRMSDIKKLEDRIKNLEYYTTLSLLEKETANFTIKDANGLDRFKSGFFVDNFTTLISQKSSAIAKNAIDVENSQLRPSVYTTSIDLILGHTNSRGNINFNDDDFDYKSNQSIIGDNVKKSVGPVGKGILTLDYSETEEIIQPYATRVENVTPYLVTFYGGIACLNPGSDIWLDPVVLDPINLGVSEGETQVVDVQLDDVPDPNSGWCPVIFGAWETSWTNVSAPREVSRGPKYEKDGKWYQDVVYATDKEGYKSRVGQTNRITFSDTPVSYGTNLVSIDIATYCRSRNIEIISKKLKPYTQMYAFFDGQSVDAFMVPKLLEIEMLSGVFQIGETVRTLRLVDGEGRANIRFRLCQPNHREGRYDSPTATYFFNPYDRTQNIPTSYSEASEFLNIDTFLLSEESIGESFGYVTSGMVLIGSSSGATAIVKPVRLITDNVGTLIASLYIPDPSIPSNPRFNTGEKVFRLSSLQSNSTVPGLLNSLAESTFFAKGTVKTTQEAYGYIRNRLREVGTLSESLPTSTTDFSQPITVEVPGPPAPPPPTPYPEPDREPEPTCAPSDGPKPSPGPKPGPSPSPGPRPSPGPSPSPGPRPSPGPKPASKKIEQFKLYTTPGTYTFTVPRGVTSIEASGVGAGGGGGYGKSSRSGGGGGGGGVASKSISVNPGEVLTIVVGAGGKGASLDNKATDGEPSYVLGKNILARGGVGGSSTSKGRGGDNSGGGGKGEDGRYDRDDDNKKGGYGGGAGLIGGGNCGHPNSEDCGTGSSRGGAGGNGIKFAGSGGTDGEVPDCGNANGGRGGTYGGGGGGGVAGGFGADGSPGAFLLKWKESQDSASTDLIPPIGLDPLAQSFTINSPDGRFVTAIDLFFQSKDDSLPIIVELRPMSLGLPTGEIYPFSQVIVYPEDIEISEDASAATRIQFDAPVYLQGDAEHAVVIKSDSTNYYAWISRLGEVDITTASLPESGRTIIASQPDISTVGSLFKSQNASTWTPSQFEDLKFTLYSAVFVPNGSVSFFNPDLTKKNKQFSSLPNNPLEIFSRKIKVDISETLNDPTFTLGNTVVQTVTGATGNYVGATGAVSSISITNSGIGYTPSNGTSFTYFGVPLENSSSEGRLATADITIGREILPNGDFNDGVAIAATISTRGTGYQKGDVLSVAQLGDQTLGRNLLLTVDDVTDFNQIIIDNVQGNFLTGIGYTLMYTNSSEINVNINDGVTVPIYIDNITEITDGLHIKVNHQNHGMHSEVNFVELSNVKPDTNPATLIGNISFDPALSSIELSSTSGFTTFENAPVSVLNPGYILIDREILSYTGVSGNQLTGITRGNTISSSDGCIIPRALPHFEGEEVYKYELNGVSLRRINTTHTLQDASVLEPIGLDYYILYIDTIRPDPSLKPLYFSETKSTGGSTVQASSNIQFEIIKPNVETFIPPKTSISADLRTVSGTSVSGVEPSFVDQGYQRVDLNVDNYMNTSRLICSKINEVTYLTDQPANKSLELRTFLTTENDRLTPVIDLDRVGAILISNRVNRPIENYINDSRVSTLQKDPVSFYYATKPISLEVPATSLRTYIAAYINRNADIRAFYALMKDPTETPIYYPFPGYSNKITSGEIIDVNNSDGTSDKFVPNNELFGNGNTENYFKDYEFSIDNLAEFRYFSIKISVSSNIQVYPPKLRDLRVIALA